MDLNELASFVRVVERGTITGAAEDEGVPKSTISRRVRRLEEHLGVELLRRTSRSFTVTADGARLYERSKGALREIAQISMDLTDRATAPNGLLVVTAPHDIGRSPLAVDIFAEYRRRYPDVRIEIRAEQRIVDLVEEGVDVALRAFRTDIPGAEDLMVREVARTPARWFASPDYIASHAEIEAPDLRGHDVIIHAAFREAVLRPMKDGTTVEFMISDPIIEANDLELIQALIERGAGIGVLPEVGARAGVADGRLIDVLPEYVAPGGRFGIVWPASRHLAPRVRAFVDLATEILKEVEWFTAR